MISPTEMVGNLSTNLTNHFDGFSTGSDPVNIANSVIDPLTNTANIKDGTVNFLENVSAVDIFFVKPDLPHWVGFILHIDHAIKHGQESFFKLFKIIFVYMYVGLYESTG